MLLIVNEVDLLFFCCVCLVFDTNMYLANINIMFLSLKSNTSILLSLYQVYYLAYLVWMSGLNL